MIGKNEFFILMKDGTYKIINGKLVDDLLKNRISSFFIHRPCDENIKKERWFISELSTGASVTNAKTQKEALSKLDKMLDDILASKEIKEIIKSQKKRGKVIKY